MAWALYFTITLKYDFYRITCAKKINIKKRIKKSFSFNFLLFLQLKKIKEEIGKNKLTCYSKDT